MRPLGVTSGDISVKRTPGSLLEFADDIAPRVDPEDIGVGGVSGGREREVDGRERSPQGATRDAPVFQHKTVRTAGASVPKQADDGSGAIHVPGSSEVATRRVEGREITVFDHIAPPFL